MSNITFILFAYNEEKRIAYTLRNLVPFGQVVVLDGGSTDGTQQIVEQYGGKFVVRPKFDQAYVETVEMYAFARQFINTKWVYWGYVDNLLPKPLLQKLTEISQQDQIKIVYVPIDTYLWGDVDHPIISASYPCFFMKDMVDFTNNKIHGLGKFLGSHDEILKLPHTNGLIMRHYSLYDMVKFITGHVRYAEAEARQKHASGKHFSLFYMFGSMGRYFWLFYRKGWAAGVRGLYIALLYSFFRLMVGIKLHELDYDITLETIEDAFRVDKEKIVKEIELKL